MAKPLPEHAELHFIETLATTTVHIEARVPVWATPDEPAETIAMGDGTGRFLAAIFGTPTIVRCGQRTFPHVPDRSKARHAFTSRFRDEQLCVACYRTLTPEDQPRAFEHEQPELESAL
ncbi:hypothetical protein ACFQ7N_39775 [Streptomyces niveus]|uniref:hypothetical protein n=1 Tax=Streptomyces niveus TaxID=193462 RepID=UPI00367679A2